MALTQVSTNSIKDATIATADIADDAVTLAKMAAGTDGQIITYDASGNPTAVGPGTDGQVLTSTGAGSPPAFETPAAGVGGATGVDFNDDVKIRFGASDDLEIFHGGGHSKIYNANGNIYISNESGNTSNVVLQATWGEESVIAKHNGAVELYYDNAKKLQTVANGVHIVGNSYHVDNEKSIYGGGDDLQIYHNGSHSFIANSTGQLQIKGDHIELLGNTAAEYLIRAIKDGAVELYYNNHKSFNTSSTGISIYGTEGGEGCIHMYADEGDDNEDYWRLTAGTDTTWYLQNYAAGSYETNIKANGNGNVELYYDNAKKFETLSNGGKLTGRWGIGTAEIAKNDHSILNVHKGDSGSCYQYFTNTTTGEAGSDGFTIGLDGDEAALLWNRENTNMRFGTNATERMTLLAGGGLTFNGDTAAANALDDYEQGSFTPTLRKSGDTTGQVDGTGAYTKIGNVVHAKICFANKACSNIPDGAVAEIVGLPFNAHHGTHTDEMAISGPMVEMGIAQRNGGIFRTTTATSYLRAYYMQNNSTWAVWYVDDFNNSGVYLIFGITYLTT